MPLQFLLFYSSKHHFNDYSNLPIAVNCLSKIFLPIPSLRLVVEHPQKYLIRLFMKMCYCLVDPFACNYIANTKLSHPNEDINPGTCSGGTSSLIFNYLSIFHFNYCKHLTMSENGNTKYIFPKVLLLFYLSYSSLYFLIIN
jgi:hypothetical protein